MLERNYSEKIATFYLTYILQIERQSVKTTTDSKLQRTEVQLNSGKIFEQNTSSGVLRIPRQDSLHENMIVANCLQLASPWHKIVPWPANWLCRRLSY